MPAGRPLKFENVEKLEHEIGEYFLSCWDYKRDLFGNRIKDNTTGQEVMIQVRPYTVGGLAVALDCCRQTLVNYGNGDGDRAEFLDTIKKAKNKIQAYAEEALYTGKNQAGAIFVMKNCYGWNDKTELDVNAKIVKMDKIKRDGVDLDYDIGTSEAIGPSGEAAGDS